jgi:hypothetical protein
MNCCCFLQPERLSVSNKLSAIFLPTIRLHNYFEQEGYNQGVKSGYFTFGDMIFPALYARV